MILIVLALVLVVFFAYRTFFASVNPEEIAANKQAGVAFLLENAKEEGVITTASGLQYKVLKEGTGSEHPSPTSRVEVHYEGTLLDGTVFDSSIARGEPISFGLNQVIKGWTEGVQLMVVGEKTRFFIPAEIAYGDRAAGKIQPGSTLIFEVELLSIDGK
ncbi:MAG: FKBP-type peptidyl-prolyl cis-trans isomerase [Gammaproteobacteria bacterium]